MRFVLVRGSHPLCNPDCPEWIAAEGTIASSTPDRLRQLLDSIGDRRLPIVVSSPGGDLLGALAAGRLIRDRKLDVAVAHTHFVGCGPETEGCVAHGDTFVGAAIASDGECRSACALMFAGGVRRLVGPHARLTIHSMGLERLVADYLDEMAVAPMFLGMMQAVMYSSHLQLEPNTMLKVGLTTGLESVDELAAPAICKSVPHPKNCRTVLATH
jgi:hypothetical protein